MQQEPPPGVAQQHFSLYETLEATSYAIAWKDDAKFLVSLAVLPATLLLTLFSKIGHGSNSSNILHLVVLGLSGLLILSAELLNTLLHRNWRSVASQNYFDENGVFMSIFWSGPLLIVFAVALVLVMKDVFQLLELPRKPNRRSPQQQGSEKAETPKASQ
ncbi:hypothetical protein M407DRAFT_243958 [Tulasnella calospora MUT 4182]|uniref:Uncharacterized protein n=1 Tax=Tulasnella calospora MUT 4182 TaxID=1051891 RepID=A0A0C3LWH4_9AGAM|nr:hypothetical protein M407DRAFT_244605 [Tulasnella calospora MUT 4182]KIO25727.1 hypothetical protein M407DRAFT_243958 [Tulasnella calospora MUT 4182]